jgi:hypothetical protein
MLITTIRALVVEDGSKMATLLRRRLQEEGFAVVLAANGEDGSWLGAENDYDVILLDVMLPMSTGSRSADACGLGTGGLRSSCSWPGTASRTAWRAWTPAPTTTSRSRRLRRRDPPLRRQRRRVALDANFHVIGDVSNDEGAAGEEGAADQNGGDED